MDRFPRTGASALVIKNKQVLLIQRKNEPYKGAWSLPGGSQHYGETLKACALRELQEETGLIATTPKFVDIKEIISPSADGEIEYHYLLGIYLISQFEGTPVAMDDAQDAKWFARDDFTKLQTTPELFPHICELLEVADITF